MNYPHYAAITNPVTMCGILMCGVVPLAIGDIVHVTDSGHHSECEVTTGKSVGLSFPITADGMKNHGMRRLSPLEVLTVCSGLSGS